MSKRVKQPGVNRGGMSEPARHYYETEFLGRYRELTKKVAETPLCVLVWGPEREKGGQLYSKRRQIRRVLRANGYAAVFSEEVDIDCKVQYASSRARELLEAVADDFIVVLYGSPGSIAEVHDFADLDEELGRKNVGFQDSRYMKGYGSSGLLHDLNTLYGNVHEYHYPADITKCHLLDAVEKRLRVLRVAKWHHTRM